MPRGSLKAWALVILLFPSALTFSIQTNINPSTFLLSRGAKPHTISSLHGVMKESLKHEVVIYVLGCKIKKKIKKSTVFLIMFFIISKPFWSLSESCQVVRTWGWQFLVPLKPSLWEIVSLLSFLENIILPSCAEHYGTSPWEGIRAFKSVPSEAIAKERELQQLLSSQIPFSCSHIGAEP